MKLKHILIISVTFLVGIWIGFILNDNNTRNEIIQQRIDIYELQENIELQKAKINNLILELNKEKSKTVLDKILD